jgi:hypothetical protein
MIYKSLNKDFYYEDSGSTRLSYYLTCENETIYTGRANNPKGIKINIRKLIEDWLWNDMPDFRAYDGVTVTHPDACKVFGLYDEESNLLEEYKVLLSYEDWNGEDMTFNEPIDGKADPRQKFFVSAVESVATTFDLYGWSRFRITFDQSLWFPPTGGTFTVGYEANSGFTMSESCDWYSVSRNIISAGTEYEKGELTFTVSPNMEADRTCYLTFKQDDYVGAVCTQPGDTHSVLVSQDKYWYFDLENVTVPKEGGVVCMEYTTNYNISQLRVVLDEGLELVSFGGGYICVRVPANEGYERDFLVAVYKGGTMVGGGKINQEGEYQSKYFTVTSGDGVIITRDGGDWVITYDTNINHVYYIAGMQTGYTSGGSVTIPISAGGEAAFHIYFYENKGDQDNVGTAMAYRSNGWYLYLKVRPLGWEPANPYYGGTSGVFVHLRDSVVARYLYGYIDKIETKEGWDWIYMYEAGSNTKFLYTLSEWDDVKLHPDNIGHNMVGDYYCDASPATSPWKPTESGYHATEIEVGYGFTELGINTLDINNRYTFPSTLTYLKLPNTIQYINSYVFYDCANLTEIYYEGTKSEWAGIHKLTNWNYNSAIQTIHCIDGDISIA